LVFKNMNHTSKPFIFLKPVQGHREIQMKKQLACF